MHTLRRSAETVVGILQRLTGKVALICLLGLSACTTGVVSGTQDRLPATPSIPATPVPTSPASLPSPTATSPPAIPNAADSAIDLTRIQMITPLEGWALGNQPNSIGLHVLRTTDGGAHWQDLSPANLGSVSNLSVFFLNLSEAWIVAPSPASEASNPPSSLAVFHTTDGGDSWQQSSSIKLPGAGTGLIDFIDSQNGWLMTTFEANNGAQGAEILQSTDGGANWQSVSLTSHDAATSTSNSLPLNCLKNGITFIDPNIGWVTGECTLQAPFLYQTNDGGQTWTAQNLPAPNGFSSSQFIRCPCGLSQIHFTGPQSGYFILEAHLQTTLSFLYLTDNGGNHWTPLKLPVANIFQGPIFMDPLTGWIASPNQLFETTDGGQSWQELKNLPFKTIEGSPDFVTPMQGWILADATLWHTSDGGQNWTGLAPAPVSISPPASSQAIQFPDGSDLASISTQLIAGAPQGYTIQLQKGQILTLLKNGLANLSILDPTGRSIKTNLTSPGPVEVEVPADGEYSLVLIGQGQVTLDLYLPPAGSATQAILPVPTLIQHIHFLPGTATVALAASLDPNTPLAYSLDIGQSQQVTVQASGQVTLALLNSQLNPVAASSASHGQWQFDISQTGTYTLLLLGKGQTTLKLTIPPLPGTVPTPTVLPAPTRISLPSTNASTTFTTTLVTGSPRVYAIYVLNKQVLYVTATGSTAVAFLKPDGSNLPAQHAAGSDIWTTTVPASGDYRIVLEGSGQSTLTIYLPPG